MASLQDSISATARDGGRTVLVLLCLAVPSLAVAANPRYVRVNQVGYLSTDIKVAVAFSNDNLSALSYQLLKVSDGSVLVAATAFPASSGAYQPFAYTYQLDFSAFQPAAAVGCELKLSDGTLSPPFMVGPCVYNGVEEVPLNFFRAQNCGTGNWYNQGVNINAPCHLAPGAGGSTGDEDGMVVDGPHKGSTLDTEGGWHDSGDLIKFMVTTAWEIEVMEVAYRENPSAFQDTLGSNLQPSSPNGVPDVLDEARYGLAWVLKMNPDAGTFYDNVADGRDHNNFGTYLPSNDAIDYSRAAAPDNGTVPKPYRPVYGGPGDQGGTQNCARAAGALAMAYQLWSAATSYQDLSFASTCLTHAQWLYALGKAQNATLNDVDGFYPSSGFDPEMELAAAELYKATGTASYLTDAQAYAAAAGSAGGELDWSQNNFLAHDCLYPVVAAAEQATLAGFMKADLDADLARSNANPYGLGYSYVWGTLEDSTSLAVMCHLWKKLNPGDASYDAMATANRDYLLGKNPWGVCFIQGMGTTWPNYPQHNTSLILYQKLPYGTGSASVNTPIPGMVIEGPVDYNDYKAQGITLSGSDPYGAFDNASAGGWVYHDDNQDYASNEPTTTGTVWAIMLFSEMASQCGVPASPIPSSTPSASRTPSATPSAIPSAAPSVTLSVTPSATPSAIGTVTSSPTGTVSLLGTLTATPSASATATGTPILTLTASPAAAATASPSVTDTIPPTPTLTASSVIVPTPTDTPTAPPASPTPSSSWTPFAAGSTCKNVWAYYTAWSKASGYDATHIPYDRLTHICHAFVIPNPDGSLQVPANYLESALIPSAHAAGVKVLVSVGGAGSGSNGFSALASSAVARANFASQLKAFLLANGYDGVDIDWEYPGSGDTANLTLMVQMLRSTFSTAPNPHPEWLLSAAVPPSYMTNNYDLTSLKTVLNYFNVMTYDYAGPWSAASGENAPLNATSADIQDWISTRGVPASQINFGLPFYGYEFPVGTLNTACPGGCASGSSLPYNQITPLLGAGWTRTWDTAASSPYLTDPSGTKTLYYDDPQSIALKANWGANSAGCAGVFFWDISMDWMGATSQPLLDAARSVLLCGTPTVTPTVTPTWTPVVYPIPGQVPAVGYASSYDTDAINQGGVYRFDGTDIETCSDVDGGYDIGWTVATEWMDYDINVVQAGNWDLLLRVAAPAAVNGAIEILVDGAPLVASVSVPATGGWQSWVSVRIPALAWTAGPHTLRVYELAGGFNFHWLEVVGPPTPTPSVSPTITPSPSASPSATAGLDGPLVLDQALPLPNPDPRTLAVLLEGPAASLTLRLYSVAYARMASIDSGPWPRGWIQVPLPPAFLADRRAGVYYWMLQARRGAATSSPLKGVLYRTH